MCVFQIVDKISQQRGSWDACVRGISTRHTHQASIPAPGQTDGRGRPMHHGVRSRRRYSAVDLHGYHPGTLGGWHVASSSSACAKINHKTALSAKALGSGSCSKRTATSESTISRAFALCGFNLHRRKHAEAFCSGDCSLQDTLCALHLHCSKNIKSKGKRRAGSMQISMPFYFFQLFLLVHACSP